MPILTDADLQSFADLVTGLLMKDTCSIQRNSQAFDSKGGSTDDLIVVANVPCALLDLSAPMQQVLAQQDIGLEHKELITPLGTDIEVDDMITTKGLAYKVLSPYGRSSYAVFTSVLVLRKIPL
jgi:hypothetical protein